MSTTITKHPQFYFPKCVSPTKKLINDKIIMNKITALYENNKQFLTEIEFRAVTTYICSLPRYMNLALFRAIDSLNNKRPNDQITLEKFKKNWPILTKDYYDDNNSDTDSLIYCILKKPNSDCLTPDDFLPVLEDIVLNHPALQFLENNITFQERYIETVICRIFYDAHCPTGKLSLKQFRKSKFTSILQSLNPSIDLYTIHNLFSYKQFYVLYCKLWCLDTDHDLSLSETDLCNYNMGTLTRLTVERILKIGHIVAFADPVVVISSEDDVAAADQQPPPCLNYFDFIWFLLSEIDKSTPMAIEYWFRCLDIDGDGVLSAYELGKFWEDQDIKQRIYGGIQGGDCNIQFEDIIRQMNDLIQPRTPGQFLLKDLKKNGYLAERFFDTFINFDRFQVHETHQEGSIREQQNFNRELWGEAYEPMILTDDLGFPVLSNWDDYADVEYHRIILDESYVNSYEEDEEEDEDSFIKCQQDNDEDEGITISSCSNSSNSSSTNASNITTTSIDNNLLIEEEYDDSIQNIDDARSDNSSSESEEANSISDDCNDNKDDGLSDILSIFSSSSSSSSSESETHTPDLDNTDLSEASVPIENPTTVAESENTENYDTFDEDECSSLGGDTYTPTNSPFINTPPKDIVLYNNKRVPSLTTTEYFNLQKSTENNSLNCIHQLI